MLSIVSSEADGKIGELVAHAAHGLGFKPLLLSTDTYAPVDSIAFFASNSGHFRNRCVRVEPARFERCGIVVPEWAHSARYLVAVRGENIMSAWDKFQHGLPEAVRKVVLDHHRTERRRVACMERMPLGLVSPLSSKTGKPFQLPATS